MCAICRYHSVDKNKLFSIVSRHQKNMQKTNLNNLNLKFFVGGDKKFFCGPDVSVVSGSQHFTGNKCHVEGKITSDQKIPRKKTSLWSMKKSKKQERLWVKYK